MLRRTLSPVQVSEAHERSTTAHLTSLPHGVEESAVPINATDDGRRDRCAFLETGESADAHAPPCASAQESACDSCRFSSVASASLASPDAVPQVSALAPAPVPCLQAPPSCAFVDVPPSAMPARRLKNVYDGAMPLPPGTTKRALGRLRIVWCCVVTAKSWHSLFVGLPILFFTTLFVTVVVPRGEWFTYVFTALFTTISVTCLTLSVTLDPGVIPPAPQSQQPTQSTTVMVGGQPVLCKVCTTCHIIRPPRSTHCRFCDVCVEEFDHHCGIIGSCVGKRTFRFFGGFFVITSFLVLYILIRSFIILVSTDFKPANERPHLIWLAVSCTLCIVAAIIGAILVMPCAGRYIMLSASNSTVKETMRTQRQQTKSGEQPPGVVPVAETKSGNYCANLRRLFSPIGRSRIPYDYYV
ncbi:DHHC palmitoyltransferase [Leishmania donovani]|nr:DHHC palmitoyltransferase [Leishmania donovani]